MSSTGYNTCVICGKDTNMRCQPCGKAGVEVFFCGAGHQREIWPVHKFFCGPNACPLIWPDLTKAEADSAWENRHLKDTSTTTTHTLVELLRKVEIEEWDLRNALLALARQASPSMQVENLRQPLLKVVRQALFDHAMLLRLGKQTSIMYGTNIVALHDLTMVLKHADLVFGRETEPWLAELIARIIGLTYRMASRRTEEPEIREQIEAIRRCRLWIQARIPESDLRREEILAELLEWLDQLEVSTKCLLQVRLMEQ